MFILLGLLIMGAVTIGALTLAVLALVCWHKKKHGAAILLVLPLIGLFALVYSGLAYQKREAEAHPQKVFQSVFGVQPFTQIRNLHGYDYGDYNSSVYLRFQASSQTVSELTKSKFTQLSAQGAASFKLYNMRNPPSWFGAFLTPQTQIFFLNKASPGSEYLLFYEPQSQTARVFFENSTDPRDPDG